MPAKDVRGYHAEYKAQQRQSYMDIGPIPDVKDQARRDSCENDFVKFCSTYRSDVFYFGWSDDHIKAAETMQSVVLNGGLYGVAMPRGSGKTTLAITCCLWAILYKKKQYICLVGATAGKAEALLKSIKTELRFNQALIEDFPEVCYPIVKLEGKATRAAGQLCEGEPTNMAWLSDMLVTPTVRGSESSIISVAGITGDIRGQQYTLPTGGICRPSMVIIDDPQTRESAQSETQTEQRIRIIQGDILGLCGPGERMSCVMPMTVIRRYDLADRLMSNEDFLDWKSIRSQMLYGKAENPELWEKYREIRDQSLKNDLGFDAAYEFYKENREKLDAGLRAGWEDRCDNGISAILTAKELEFRDYEAFQAEYQNEPQDEADTDSLTEADVVENISHLKYGETLLESDKVVGFIDVQKNALYWVIMSFSHDFTGSVVDYGHWPEQRDKNMAYRNLRTPLEKVYPNMTFEERLRRSLTDCTDFLMSQPFVREDGVTFDVSRLLIDANWGISRDIIYSWVRASKHRQRIVPSHGKFIGASSQPLNHAVTKNSASRIGTHWRLSKSKEMPIMYALYDTNYWKSFATGRFKSHPGVSGSVVIPNDKPRAHKEFVSNMLSEYPVRVEGRGRVVDEWKLKPGADNHWFDCVVGCCVAASMEGSATAEQRIVPRQAAEKPKRKKVQVL